MRCSGIAVAAYRARVKKGIVEAFNSVRIQKNLARYNPEGSRFAILTTSNLFVPLVESNDLSLLWSNNPGFTVSRIVAE